MKDENLLRIKRASLLYGGGFFCYDRQDERRGFCNRNSIMEEYYGAGAFGWRELK